ncbi:CaiB/BaiF CoA transferase family protein [Anaerotignum sp.]|uniref:CaiB/BaiF CoA transferase family protein n=1 Tax=Anaerotignum sp. TaxID=2039241 RepID=UPI0028B04347|nr:CaiB/BaiF CoA-transferase family protein [Anaerotignum sp.]
MKPLKGIKIVDFTQAHAGSLATMLLADMGAEVIKIERLGVGDLARYWEPMKDSESGYYAYLNRGKKSISINASSKEGKEIISKLIKDADVVTENFKFGSMERMGFSYEEVKAIKSDIIYASLNGFGQYGEMKNVIGLDLQLQAMSGAMDSTGFVEGAPTKIGAAFGDHTSGNYLALGILSALIHRNKTGEGRKIDVAILDSVFSLMPEKVVEFSAGNENQSRIGNSSADYAPCDIFQVKDGYVYMEIKDERAWYNFCLAIGNQELLESNLFATNSSRVAVYDTKLKPLLKDYFDGFSTNEIVALLNKNNVPCVKIHSVKEAMDSEITKNNGMLVKVKDKVLGEISMPQSSYVFENIDTKIKDTAPLQGEHSLQYIRKLGYTEDEIRQLIENKIIEQSV